MALTFSIPGKTFLAGEYLALNGGPALIFASKPVFELTAVRSPEKSWPNWHPDSPAGAFLQQHADFFSGFKLNFSESYEGRGGFGASTAQFLAVYALWLFKEQSTLQMETLLDFRHLLSEYEKYAWNGEGTKPSGADLIGQLKGALTFFERSQGLISVKSWPFVDLDFLLVHTGNKLATHEHLKSLSAFSDQGLRRAFEKIKLSFETADSSQFIAGILDYAEELKHLNFTCEATLKILEKLKSIPGVRAAKGCGALGADVVLIVCQKSLAANVKAAVDKMNLACLTSAEQVSPGLQIKGSL